MGVTNPTAALGKGATINDWGIDVVSLSETSHTRRAVSALYSEFRMYGFALSLSDPVPDKFCVSDPSGSYRGLSRGVALVSRFPVFTPRPSFLPDIAWCSQRLLYSVVQFGQTPIHFVSVYLFPNAALGSQKYLLNCKILHWAHQILTSVDAPCVLCGDFNAPLESFETCKALSLCGWTDLAVLSQQLFGTALEPTCKNATRHSFAFGNPSVQRFVKGAEVCHLHDLDSHAVQKFDLDVPSFNVPAFKWPQPRALHEFHCNHSGLRTSALRIAGPLRQQVHEALSAGDATTALRMWSSACEKAIISHSSTDEGEPLAGKRYLGRAANLNPVKRVLAAPRFKPGRKSDFAVSFPSVALKVRQVQKQSRRLQSLVRLLKAQFFGPQHFGKVHDLWSAISRSSGFVPCFLSWASSSIGSTVGALPDFSTLCTLKDLVCAYANRLASQQWRLKKEIFTTQLEVSMKAGGGKLAFRCLKERALPQVRSLKVVEELKLAPQRWLPTGKSWFHVVNHFAFDVGDLLEGEDFTVKLLEKQGDSLHVDKLLTRRQAAHLRKKYVTSNPEEWAPHFLSQWSDFWNRDDPDEVCTEHVPFLDALEATPEVDFGPLTISHWHHALRTSKSSTMCGTDNWCIPDLKLLPDSLASILLDIYNSVETSGISWPVQLSNWLLVVLRKTDCDTPDWTLLRPISVAGILYRLWARMRTVDCMRHCKSFRTPLVAPNLSTRAIWYFLSDYLDQQYTLGRRPCGAVLDIIKCFNILSRDVVYDIMVTLGFPERVLGAWFRALSSMSRSVLVDGAVFGQLSASTGVPEGDPLAVVAMFCVSLAFFKYIKQKVPEALVCTYADNWEAVCLHPDVLAKLLTELRPFLLGLKLPVNPQKCWTWSLDPFHRKQLKSFRWDGEKRFPVKLQARELGADISYCLRKAARVRNQRIAKGHQRLLRLAGLPLPRLCKQRLLFSGIFPQTLHASETAIVPKSVYVRLRSKTALSVGAAKKGSNPYIACLLACPRIVDPQFVQVLGRVRLFRQVLRELPSYTDVFLDGLSANTGRYKGPSRILRKELLALGWTLFGRATFGDLHGRSFHLVLTPFLHIEYLLSTTWSQHVAERVTHRKGMENLASLELDFCRPGPGFRPNEQGLLLNQQSGAFFTEDFRKHIPGSSICCPLCGQADSRAHRLELCPHTSRLRQVYSALFRAWDTLVPHEKYFGLFEEIQGTREVRAALGRVPFPTLNRRPVGNHYVVYTDGSCLFPRIPQLRVASFASLIAGPDGAFEVLAQGLVPGGCHSAFRGEVMGLASAVHSVSSGVICCDCLSAVNIANDLLAQLRSHVTPELPLEHLDLWSWFLEGMAECELGSLHFQWVKGHTSWKKTRGLARLHAWYNHWADRAAAEAGKWVVGLPAYRSLIRSYMARRRLSRLVHDYQVQVAFTFAQKVKIEHPEPVPVTFRAGYGFPLSPYGACIEDAAFKHEGFARKFVCWLEGLQWFPSAVGLPHCDTSWLELFWGFIRDTASLPPFRVGSTWVSVDDDITFGFALPSVKALFRTWRCCLDSLVRCGLVVPWVVLPTTQSAVSLGARFACPGISGHVALPPDVRVGLSFQFARSRCLADLRIPSFY